MGCFNFIHHADKFQGAFAFYAPKLYRCYSDNLEKLFKRETYLRPNHTGSIFPAATFNLGPNTVTLDHTDPGNVAYGWCALTALGKFNAKTGGHLILFDLGLVIQFPPGSTILIPSSVFRHGNTPISAGESRLSITQYCAGGLFRWVKYGFKSAAEVVASRHGMAKMKDLRDDYGVRTEEALNLFSLLDELEHDRKHAFHRK